MGKYTLKAKTWAKKLAQENKVSAEFLQEMYEELMLEAAEIPEFNKELMEQLAKVDVRGDILAFIKSVGSALQSNQNLRKTVEQLNEKLLACSDEAKRIQCLKDMPELQTKDSQSRQFARELYAELKEDYKNEPVFLQALKSLIR